MATLGFKFGSYAFSGTGGLIYDFEIKGGSRTNQNIIPLKDGAQINQSLLSPLQVTFKGTLSGTSAGHLRLLKDYMFNAIFIGTGNLYVWDDQYVVAQMQSIQYDYQAAMSFMPFQVTFVAGTPFWVAATATTNQQTVSSTPKTYSITTSGSAYSKPTITFIANQAGTIANFSFENSTTNENFAYLGSVALNGTLVVDCDNYTVELNGADVVGSFSGDFLKLGSGANAMTYSGGNCTVRVSWQDRYY